ncbi:RASD2 [Ecytonucleospora hepatopenaei]|uniref:RASD2 n=1 Tax=Ecytonucleospora hepatopenaei TaxID=646526 RepID=A0A1W0E3S4_9MICR|nr:RASD2 [Ecytonucleospora hepatopenaei]
MENYKTYDDLVLKNKDKVYQVTLLGAYGCGKTSLLNKFIYGKKENTEIMSRAIENKKTNKSTIKIYHNEEKNVYLRFFDPSCHKEYTRLRDLTIPVSDYVVLMYAIDNREGFYEAQHVFSDIIKRKGKKGVKVLICATKTDKLGVCEEVSFEEGKLLGKEMNVIGRGGVSVVVDFNIKEIFDVIIKDILKKENPPKHKNFFCC